MRSKQTIADIRPEDDADKDGASNLTEYLAGTYAFDPKEGFSLAIGPVEAGRAALDFTAIRGRSYTIHASDRHGVVGTGAICPVRRFRRSRQTRCL